MIKNMITTSLLTATLLLSGCGESETESRLSVQQALDRGDFSSVISSLESKEVKTDEDNMVLASAYMGEAGFSFTDTINLLSASTAGESTDGFTNFAESVENIINEDTLNNLQSAIDYYNAIGINTNNAPAYSSDIPVDDTTYGDRDLFLSFAYLSKASVVMSYLGGIQDSDIQDELLASACAIVHIYAPSSNLPIGCVDVTNVAENNNTRLDIVLENGDGMTYYRLANAEATEMYLTNYITPLTPILINGDVVTIKDVLIDTINDAFDLILEVAPDDVQEDIIGFKNEIGVDPVTGKITSETVSNYLAQM